MFPFRTAGEDVREGLAATPLHRASAFPDLMQPLSEPSRSHVRRHIDAAGATACSNLGGHPPSPADDLWSGVVAAADNKGRSGAIVWQTGLLIA